MADNKQKHLEFIQNVITRMNSNSFLIKGWAITLISAICALAANDANVKYILISYISVLIFWGLDGYYLSKERQFRALYKVVAGKVDSAIDYSMDVSSYNNGKNTWISSTFSVTVWVVFVAILLITTIIMCLFIYG
ncbi:hypothetical protein GZH53_17400 [Flavihumibacter sp. R14]|nr:hypothetical protein [Flavihumibacter soli]